MAEIQGIEKLRLGQGIGIQGRLQSAQHLEKAPGGKQGCAGEQSTFERNGRPPTSEPGHQSAFRRRQIVGSKQQAQPKHDEENDECSESDCDEQANHRRNHSGFHLDVAHADDVRSIGSTHSIVLSGFGIGVEDRQPEETNDPQTKRMFVADDFGPLCGVSSMAGEHVQSFSNQMPPVALYPT
jgi:hypothetical protein